MSDGTFRDEKPTDSTDMTLKMRKRDFGVCMCELETQPNKTGKIGHRMEIENCALVVNLL